MDPLRCLEVVVEERTQEETVNVTTIPCARLIERAIGTAKFNPDDHLDLILYCYAVHVGIVTNGTLELNITQFNDMVKKSKIITEVQRSMLLGQRCTNFVDCFLQPCNVTINQLGVINQTQGQ